MNLSCFSQASLKPLAYVKRDGKVKAMDASLLVPGDMVMLASGGAVPADCFINEGQIDVDQVRSCPLQASRRYTTLTCA
jgi:magnesium-transporting ATPase (P-type)